MQLPPPLLLRQQLTPQQLPKTVMMRLPLPRQLRTLSLVLVKI
jgi:hypothetical protein